MIGFIDDYRGAYGVEPICRALKIAPSTYHAHDARRRRPDTAPPRVQRDAALRVEIRRVFDENFQVYGVRKVWQGVIRGRRVRTTISDMAAPCPLGYSMQEVARRLGRAASTISRELRRN